MIDITGKLPVCITDKLSNLGVVVSDVNEVGDDIDITLTRNGVKTVLYAIYIGGYKWNIETLDDAANLFPVLEEGDSVSIDNITKLFVNTINSSLILSFNPLGNIKYGLQDKVNKIKDKVSDVKKKVGDVIKDRIDADQAEQFLRENSGKFKYTFHDERDNQDKKKTLDTASINVGKVEPYGDKGNYKVLTGNPSTGDYQVWHLFRSGNNIRMVELKAGLESEEALWVYDNNLPKEYSEEDWNPEAAEDNTVEGQTEDGTAEDTDEAEYVMVEGEEDNLVEGTDNTEQAEGTDNTEQAEETETVTTSEENNVVEGETDEEKEKKEKEKEETEELIQSEYDNVTEDKKKKKSKYNGMNVTGCSKPDGTVVMASLILSTLSDFREGIKKIKLAEEPRQFLTKLLTELKQLPQEEISKITKDSNNNVLLLNFGNTDLTTENYVGQFELYNDRIIAKLIGIDGITGKDAGDMCIQTLKKINQKSSQ